MAIGEGGEVMTFMTSIGLIFVALVFLVGEMYRDHKKNKRLDRFLIDKEERKVKTKFNSFLVKFGKEHRKDLEQKLQNAGYYNKDFAKYYFPMKIAIIAVAFFLIMLMDTTQGNKVAYFVLAVVGAIIVPDAVLALRKKWVVRKIS
ncbi:type II secretion system F family protein, partial [Vibrio owensii]